jgi:hypothetical protein
MRRRINRTLLTATAASASVITLGFMATGAVGAATTTAGMASVASTVTPILSKATGCVVPTPLVVTPSTCAVAGYQASGRLFRYAQASIVVPNHDPSTIGTVGSGATADIEPDGAAYVALDNSSDTANDFTRVGIVACPIHVPSGGAAAAWPCPASSTATPATFGWYVFAAVVQPDITTQMTPVTHLLDPSQEGQGVLVSVYLSPTGNSVHTLIKTPTTTGPNPRAGGSGGATLGHTYNDTFAVNGPTYWNANAVADWTGVSGTGIAAPFKPVATYSLGNPGTVAYTQFQKGRFTTWNGTRGTFNGKWTVTPFEATTDGTTTTGTVVTSPGYLWSSTSGYANDAFGVWVRR